MLIGNLYNFFREKSVQILCPLFKLSSYNWVVRLFIYSTGKSITRYMIWYIIYIYIYESMSSLFTYLIVSLNQRFFLILMKSNLSSIFKNLAKLKWTFFPFSNIYTIYQLVCLYLYYLLKWYLEKLKTSFKIFICHLLSSLKSTY